MVEVATRDGESGWPTDGFVRPGWWARGGGDRDGGVETLASRPAVVRSWVLGPRAGGLDRVVGGLEMARWRKSIRRVHDVRVFGSRAGGLNRVVGVEAAGEVVAAVRCGGGERDGRCWQPFVRSRGGGLGWG